MSKSKKILMLIFTITLVVNLQLTGNLTSGMDNGFSLEQLADNIFAPSAFANELVIPGVIWIDWEAGGVSGCSCPVPPECSNCDCVIPNPN